MMEDFAVFEFLFTAELETLVAKDNNDLYYARLAIMAAVTLQSSFVGFYMNGLSTQKKKT